MSKDINIKQINEAAKRVADAIHAKFHPDAMDIRQVNLYGVPRGGITAAYAVAGHSYRHMTMQVVDDPRMAEVIIDDLIDSGATKAHFKKLFPGTPFLALFGPSDEWLSFPWERGRKDASAEDIPLRLLQFMGEDVSRGGLKETPQRYLKAWDYYTSGYNQDVTKMMKVFEDGSENCDEMILVKDIPVFSHCEHHLAPFYGKAHIAYIPNGKILGLSKLVRIAEIFMRRLQVQERLTNQIAEAINEGLHPLGVAVVIDCEHTCMIGRGVKVQGSSTITSSMKGVFKNNPETRAEFMSLIK